MQNLDMYCVPDSCNVTCSRGPSSDRACCVVLRLLCLCIRLILPFLESAFYHCHSCNSTTLLLTCQVVSGMLPGHAMYSEVSIYRASRPCEDPWLCCKYLKDYVCHVMCRYCSPLPQMGCIQMQKEWPPWQSVFLRLSMSTLQDPYCRCQLQPLGQRDSPSAQLPVWC